MSLLCNPVNQAHIDDLKDRLSGHLIFAPYDPFDDTNELRVVRKLVGIVRAMDKGVLNLKAVQKVRAEPCRASRNKRFVSSWWSRCRATTTSPSRCGRGRRFLS